MQRRIIQRVEITLTQYCPAPRIIRTRVHASEPLDGAAASFGESLKSGDVCGITGGEDTFVEENFV
jgi:hypothetical protein